MRRLALVATALVLALMGCGDERSVFQEQFLDRFADAAATGRSYSLWGLKEGGSVGYYDPSSGLEISLHDDGLIWIAVLVEIISVPFVAPSPDDPFHRPMWMDEKSELDQLIAEFDAWADQQTRLNPSTTCANFPPKDSITEIRYARALIRKTKQNTHDALVSLRVTYTPRSYVTPESGGSYTVTAVAAAGPGIGCRPDP